MAGKGTLLVGPMRIGKGKTIDPALAKGMDKVMLQTALKAFKKYNAVKSTKEKTGHQYEATLTTLSLVNDTLTCEIEAIAHPLGKLKPILKASNAGSIKGGTARDAGDVVAAVIQDQAKKIEGQLHKIK